MKAALTMSLMALAFAGDNCDAPPSAFNAVRGHQNYIDGQFNANDGDFNQITGNANGNIGSYNFIKCSGNILGLGGKGAYNAIRGNRNIIDDGSFNALTGDENFVDGSANGIFSDRNKVDGSGNLVVTKKDIGLVKPQIDDAFKDLGDSFGKQEFDLRLRSQKLRAFKAPKSAQQGC